MPVEDMLPTVRTCVFLSIFPLWGICIFSFFGWGKGCGDTKYICVTLIGGLFGIWAGLEDHFTYGCIWALCAGYLWYLGGGWLPCDISVGIALGMIIIYLLFSFQAGTAKFQVEP